MTDVWGPSTAAKAVLGAALLVLLVADVLADGPGRLLVTPLAVAVALLLARAVVRGQVLAAGPDGLRVLRGVTVHHVPWTGWVRGRVVRARDRALELELVADGQELLVVLGPLSLGAEPATVLARLEEHRAAAVGGLS